MKSILKPGILITLAAGILILGACVSKQIIFDENLPQEQASSLFFYPGLEVIAYNGIEVPHKKTWPIDFKKRATKSEWRYVLLPPGETEFVVDVYINTSIVFFIGENLLFRYAFEAGIDYVIFPTIFGGPNQDEYGIDIYTSNPKKYWKSENLAGFVLLYDAEGRAVQLNDFYKK